ncbi:hypothetical protein PGT21_017718 [Puccinia graminis f. sp. tritici]|uniref:Uncharacterized protein n=1 Tax=Puccinia graminis f. sp. tritici TaxID=56615 RepID=A0A5B0LXV0_PUCGR|nr:hypothetical protein PGTUg99_035001 [Puccinia graminis f. sp. tritici]KAA1104270.1 hypothetical protein PGT21_017718 [Puccinia graminis f. sp. tritici]
MGYAAQPSETSRRIGYPEIGQRSAKDTSASPPPPPTDYIPRYIHQRKFKSHSQSAQLYPPVPKHRLPSKKMKLATIGWVVGVTLVYMTAIVSANDGFQCARCSLLTAKPAVFPGQTERDSIAPCGKDLGNHLICQANREKLFFYCKPCQEWTRANVPKTFNNRGECHHDNKEVFVPPDRTPKQPPPYFNFMGVEDEDYPSTS